MFTLKQQLFHTIPIHIDQGIFQVLVFHLIDHVINPASIAAEMFRVDQASGNMEVILVGFPFQLCLIQCICFRGIYRLCLECEIKFLTDRFQKCPFLRNIAEETSVGKNIDAHSHKAVLLVNNHQAHFFSQCQKHRCAVCHGVVPLVIDIHIADISGHPIKGCFLDAS